MSSYLEYSAWLGTLSYKANQREFSGEPKKRIMALKHRREKLKELELFRWRKKA